MSTPWTVWGEMVLLVLAVLVCYAALAFWALLWGGWTRYRKAVQIVGYVVLILVPIALCVVPAVSLSLGIVRNDPPPLFFLVASDMVLLIVLPIVVVALRQAVRDSAPRFWLLLTILAVWISCAAAAASMLSGHFQGLGR